MDGSERSTPASTDDAVEDAAAEEDAAGPLSTKGSFGTAVGAAMLGFEQALRNEPPAEILAAEHMPERGHAGQDSDLVIEVPEPLAGKDRPRP